MTCTIDERIVALANAGDGVVTHARLSDVGMAPASIQRRVGSLLRPVAKGVYLVGPRTDSALLRAALLAASGSVASHETSARLHGMAVGRTGGPVHVSWTSSHRRGIVGVRFHRTVALDADDRTTVGGFDATTIERTLCDLAAGFHLPRLRHLTERELVDRRITRSSLHAQILSFVRRGRTGSALLRELLLHLGDDEPIPASALERRMDDILRRAGIVGVRRQFRPPWYDGIRGVVDFAVASHRLIIEADGRRWHAVTQAQESDRRRDRIAVGHGWTVLRFGSHEITQRSRSLVEELRSLLGRRTAELGASEPDSER